MPVKVNLLSIVVLGAMVALPLTGNANEPRVLDGKTVRETVAGRRIFLAVPFGGELPLYYRRDGRVDGTGEAAGIGRFLKPTDSGRWWVDGNRLCQQWESWYDGKTFCFTLAPAGPNRLAWFRDDGEKGVARLGD
jgi:hypothetical protein